VEKVQIAEKTFLMGFKPCLSNRMFVRGRVMLGLEGQARHWL
jgi:hypothetical protein